MKNSKMKYTEEKYFKIMQNIENDYEAQQLNEFYDQERIEWKPVAKSQKQIQLEKIRNTYYLKRTILQQNIKGKSND